MKIDFLRCSSQCKDITRPERKCHYYEMQKIIFNMKPENACSRTMFSRFEHSMCFVLFKVIIFYVFIFMMKIQQTHNIYKYWKIMSCRLCIDFLKTNNLVSTGWRTTSQFSTNQFVKRFFWRSMNCQQWTLSVACSEPRPHTSRFFSMELH